MKKVCVLASFVVLSCGFTLGQTYKVLWSFGGAPNDGANPVSNLILDDAGNLYGTTRLGGTYDSGTVFELSPNSNGTWTETVLYNFCTLQCFDGSEPEAGLVFDSLGNLYGTTKGGGTSPLCPAENDCGTVFKLSPPSSQGGAWTESVLYSFCALPNNNSCEDGYYPVSQLAIDASGNLYGTTSTGGTGHYPDNTGGGGTVFELSPTPSGWTFSSLYSFCSLGQGKICPDGNAPLAGLKFDGSGNLIGTTEFGGGQNQKGQGVVYKLSPSALGWTESTIYGSISQNTGSEFEGAVSIRGSTIYGTFFMGGNNGDNSGGVFRVNPTHETYVTLPFSYVNGANPAAGMIVSSANNALFGTSSMGGANGRGTLFEVTPPGFTVLYNFCSATNCTDGANAFGSLIEDQAGNLYGTTKLGGGNNNGVVFEITP